MRLMRKATPKADVDSTPDMPGKSASKIMYPAVLFVIVWSVLFAVAWWSVASLTMHGRQPIYFPNQPWLDAWMRWDSGWYQIIANEGYSYVPGQQSPVAFFPLYPLLMRIGAQVTQSSLVAGYLISLVSGFGALVLFYSWARERLTSKQARLAAIALVIYPFSYYLFGAVHSDALFLLATLAAFALLERRRYWLAGLAAALATATRPVGIIVVLGLWLRALEMERKSAGEEARSLMSRLGLSGLRWHHAGLALAPAGLVLYCLFLWYRFGDPFAFASVAGAPGWDQPPGPHTWFKVSFFKAFFDYPPLRWGHIRITAHALITIPAFALVPSVYRRFGVAYGTYALAVLLMPAIASKDFMGMGRYILAAFPCFAALGAALSERARWVRIVVAGSSAVLLLVITSTIARGFYVS